jgi:2-polyprenyl-6-methoxyphenol hydroxylase-like FAD-dependent oxidoreductase
MREAPIGIVGGGPVGMVLALFLARHGVPTVIFNTEPDSRWYPKGSTHNARTMEHYRTLGLSTELRQIGLPLDHPTDVAYFTRYSRREIARVFMQSEAEKLAAVAASARTDQVPEPIHRANQMYVEKCLFDHVGRSEAVTGRYGWRVTAMSEGADGVSVAAERVADGAREDWRFAYLIGADGGQGFVRRTLGVRYAGFENLVQDFMGGQMIATFLRIPALLPDIIGHDRRAWQYTMINPSLRMVLVSLNGVDEYLLHTPSPERGVAPDSDAMRRHVQRAIGLPIPVEVLGHRPWIAGVAVAAERFATKRVALAGDAAHLFTPTGGFGMNTGVDDAANLSWKLAALVQGWGGPNLLASYEIERRPIGIRNTTAARALAITIGDMPVPRDIDGDTEAAVAARQKLGHFLDTHLGEEFASIGIQLGARYDGSPLIVPDGAPPVDDPVTYRCSAVPGGRAPHLWLGRGRDIGDSLYDRLGVGFTLLCLGSSDGAALAEAARRRGVPLRVMRIEDDDARALYERDYVLIRPDRHIAWRGNALPDDGERLLARVTGHS